MAEERVAVAGPPSGRRRRRRKILLALAILLGGYAILEIAVRIAVGSPLAERRPLLQIRAHETRGWAMTPSSEHYTYHHRVRVNALGLRGPEVPPKAGRQRVLVVGDTFVYGLGLGGDETLPAQLQRELGDGHEVINGGVRAYATNQELALLRELGPAIQPDLVVLCWHWNDLLEIDVKRAHARIAGKGDVAFDTRSKLQGWTLFRWRVRELLRKSAVLMALHEWNKDPERLFPREPGFERMEQRLREFKELAPRLVLFIAPDPLGLKDDHPSRALETRAAEIGRNLGLPVIYPLEELRGFEKIPVIPYDGHYNAAAHSVMARSLAQEVRSQDD